MKVETIEEIHQEFETYPDREGEKFVRLSALMEKEFTWVSDSLETPEEKVILFPVSELTQDNN